jgi:hypothetical protein
MEITKDNCAELIEKYIEHAQQKGAYLLQEADLLQRAINFFKGTEKELNEENAKQVMIQGVVKGQRSGAYNLADAAFLFKLVSFFQNERNVSKTNKETEDTIKGEERKEETLEMEDDDLSELSRPVPLIPKEI